MNLVSLLGLGTLLGLAFLLSRHHRRVRLRTVVWGLGLQFLFAVIVLQNNWYSFVGMILLGLLVVAYLWRDHVFLRDFPFAGALVVVGALAVGGAAYHVAAHVSFRLLLLLLVAFMLVNGIWFKRRTPQLLAATLFIAVLIGGFVQHRLYGQVVFRQFSDKVTAFLNLSDYGAKFLFGNLADPRYFPPATTWPGFGFQFAFKVLPTIIFFGAVISILYYLGVMQKIIGELARFMRWTMGTSGAETLSCSANIFVGQTEAPLLIKPFLQDLTQSELSTVMVGGFATIAGGVLAGYVAMGVDAGHLIAASVMGAPAALVIGKIIYPETEHSVTAGDVSLPELERAANVLDAASSGITDGLKLAVNVGAMLIGFIALIAVVDVCLNWLDAQIDGPHRELVDYPGDVGFSPVTQEFEGVFPGSLKTLFGTIFKPIAWLMGVPWNESAEVGNLLGIKLSLNEFVAYSNLAANIKSKTPLSPRAQTIATYALCGFANFSSIGIQLGGIGALAPNRRRDLSKVALRAMLGGAIANCTTASIAGMLVRP